MTVESLLRLGYQSRTGLAVFNVVLNYSFLFVGVFDIEMPTITVELSRFLLVCYCYDETRNQTDKDPHANRYEQSSRLIPSLSLQSLPTTKDATRT